MTEAADARDLAAVLDAAYERSPEVRAHFDAFAAVMARVGADRAGSAAEALVLLRRAGLAGDAEAAALAAELEAAGLGTPN